jgi:DNA-binding NtrC family response regulator
VIQEREFERIGGNRTQTVDVRILAATNRDLRELVDQGEFRLDLYYRLNVFPITVPPLRRRKEDVPGLLNHFLRKMAHEYGRNLFLTPGALDFLTASDWPGNVRELEHLVERLVIMAEGDRIDETLVRLALDTGAGAPAGHAGPAPGPPCPTTTARSSASPPSRKWSAPRSSPPCARRAGSSAAPPRPWASPNVRSATASASSTSKTAWPPSACACATRADRTPRRRRLRTGPPRPGIPAHQYFRWKTWCL